MGYNADRQENKQKIMMLASVGAIMASVAPALMG